MKLQNVQIGCGQITWRDVPEEQVLTDIAQAGYAGAPAGPRKGRSDNDTLALYDQYNLLPAPGYLGADFWDPAQEKAIIGQAKAYAGFGLFAELTEIYVAAGGFTSYTTASGRNRMQIAGNVKPEDGMTDAEYQQFAKVLNQVGEITLEKGVQTCFHNHVGSVIETRAEIDRLFSLVDRDVVFMGPDTGHLAWAGADVLAFCRDYGPSIRTIHIKDIDQAVMDQGVDAEWDYMTFSKNGIWTEIGLGAIDFPALFDTLAESDFEGWIIVETDVTQQESPLKSAEMSRAYLRTLGL